MRSMILSRKWDSKKKPKKLWSNPKSESVWYILDNQKLYPKSLNSVEALRDEKKVLGDIFDVWTLGNFVGACSWGMEMLKGPKIEYRRVSIFQLPIIQI